MKNKLNCEMRAVKSSPRPDLATVSQVVKVQSCQVQRKSWRGLSALCSSGLEGASCHLKKDIVTQFPERGFRYLI